MHVQECSAASSSEDVAASNWQMRVVCVRRFAAVPVRLTPLPTDMQVHLKALAITVHTLLALTYRYNLISFSAVLRAVVLVLLTAAVLVHTGRCACCWRASVPPELLTWEQQDPIGLH